MEYTYAIVVVVDVVAGFVVIACNVVVADATVIDNVVAKDYFYYIFLRSENLKRKYVEISVFLIRYHKSQAVS